MPWRVDLDPSSIRCPAQVSIVNNRNNQPTVRGHRPLHPRKGCPQAQASRGGWINLPRNACLATHLRLKANETVASYVSAERMGL